MKPLNKFCEDIASSEKLKPIEFYSDYAMAVFSLSSSQIGKERGCVAKTYKGQPIGIVCILLSSNSKERFDKSDLRDNIPLVDSFYLSFANHIHRFDSAQPASRAVKRLEPHHRFYNSLDVPMLLFNYIIQIFALP